MSQALPILFGNECRINGNLETKVGLRTQGMLALTIEGVSERTFTTTALLNPGWYAAVFNLSGVGLIRSELSHRWYVASENSVQLFRDQSKLIMRVPKGRHRVEILLWRSQALPELHDWLTADLRLKNEGVELPSLGSKLLSPISTTPFAVFKARSKVGKRRFRF